MFATSSGLVSARTLSGLHISVSKQLGETRVEVAFSTDARVTALFGPSGSGKSSLLNMIAGLLKPERGRILLGTTILFDHDASVSVPTHKRRIGYVFQDARLFSHVSVRENLDYERRMNGLAPDAGEYARVTAMLDIESLLDRRPGALSGGARQRVAIGRALLLKPTLLLLDEPLASLDEDRKKEIFPYLERLRDTGIPIVYVSHARDEVERLADVVVQLRRGAVQDIISIERGVGS